MAQVKSSLEVVDEWKKKCFDFYAKSDDVLASTMVKLLDAMSIILKGYDHSRIVRALAMLEYERSLQILSENSEEPTIRTMMFGVLQSIHGTLLDMTSSKISNHSKETQSDEIPNSSPSIPSIPREEPVQEFQSIAKNNQVLAEDLTTFKEEGVTGVDEVVPNFTLPFPIEPKEELKEIKDEEMMEDFVIPNYYEHPIKPKEESVDEIQDFSDDNQMLGDFDPILGEENNEITSNMEELNETVESAIEGEDSSAEISNEKEDVEKEKATDNTKNIQKKRKSSYKGISETESAKKKPKGMNATELECPECEYRTRNVRSWEAHLKTSHSTTPTLAGMALLCDCGIESRSAKHIRNCDIANFAVIRKSDGPIRRFSDVKLTPQCVLCEMFPKSITGYASHLHKKHNSSLKKIDMFLKCSCGFDAFYNPGSQNTEYKKHSEECDSCQFTLHKLEDN